MIRLGSFEDVGDIANDAEVAGIILTCYDVSTYYIANRSVCVLPGQASQTFASVMWISPEG